MAVDDMTALQKIAPPALPQAQIEYTKSSQDQLNSVHRLFYTRLTSTVNSLIAAPVGSAVPGSSYLYAPYAAISRNTDKTFTANTATQITFETNDYLSACANSGLDGVSVTCAGLYNYQYSVQFENSENNTIHSAWIWLRKNGADIANTSSKFDVPGKHGGDNGALIAACNFFVGLSSDDTIEMWAAVSSTHVSMKASAAQVSPFSMPGVPSVVATLSFVSAV
jgi:hypothetical protein